MKVSVDWLKDYVDVRVPVHEIAEKLTMTLNEVDEITSLDYLSELVVGEITAVKRHPDAVRLWLTTVDVGKGPARQIVCGAPNVAQGVKVPAALPGTVLPDGLKIEKRQIRGEVSEGMLCSPRELGVGEDHSGIWLLPADATVGVPLPQALGSRHDSFELEVLANRPDCMGHLGVAREVAAAYGLELKEPKLKTAASPFGKAFILNKLDSAFVSRFSFMYLTGLQAQESPRWLKDRLASVGVRPISVIVDVTNFVMLEYGQPMHAFDADKLPGRNLGVRGATKGEHLITLDGQKRRLPLGAPVVMAEDTPVAIAGIIGGASTEVDDQTKTIVLEAAHWQPATIRRTSRKLGLRTEASARFERGISETLTITALRRAADLVTEICGGTVEQVGDHYPKPTKPVAVSLGMTDLNSFLGAELTGASVKKSLISLGFKVTGTKALSVTAPPWRTDISEPVDIYEESARIYGYDKLPSTLPSGPVAPPPADSRRDLENGLCDRLVAFGLTEVMTHSMVGDALLRKVRFPADHQLVAMANPISEDHAYLRPSLLPRHLESVTDNLRWQETVKMFEFGRVFEGGKTPQEIDALQVTLGTKIKKDLFSDVRGVLTAIFDALRLPEPSFVPRQSDLWQDGRSFAVIAGGATSGLIGEYAHPAAFKARHIVSLTLLTPQLVGVLPAVWQVAMPSELPSVRRDISVYVPGDKTYADLRATVKVAGSSELFAVGSPREYVSEGRRSLTVTLEFRGKMRTLTDAEVNQALVIITAALNTAGFEVRG